MRAVIVTPEQAGSGRLAEVPVPQPRVGEPMTLCLTLDACFAR